MNALRTTISRLGHKLMDLVKDNDDDKHLEDINKIENAIDMHREELEGLIKNAQEVEAAREK